jgi:hypothetical protein
MPISTIPYDAPMPVIYDEGIHTHSLLLANPLTAGLAQAYDAFFLEWTIVNNQEIKLRTALVQILALLGWRDTALDGLVNETQQAVLIETKNNRKAPEFLRYFGSKAAYEVRKSFLGPQLETMRGWVPSLQSSSTSLLSDIGMRMNHAIVGTDLDLTTKAKLDQESVDFRTIGLRKTFIDNFNALRKATYGKLLEMPHAYPKEHLPQNFAEAFFRHESAPKVLVGTSEDFRKQLKAHQAAGDALQAKLAKALADEAAAAKDKSEEDAEDAAIEQEKLTMDASAARLAELLEAKKKKKRP